MASAAIPGRWGTYPATLLGACQAPDLTGYRRPIGCVCRRVPGQTKEANKQGRFLWRSRLLGKPGQRNWWAEPTVPGSNPSVVSYVVDEFKVLTSAIYSCYYET